jgi:hypothetical protein
VNGDTVSRSRAGNRWPRGSLAAVWRPPPLIEAPMGPGALVCSSEPVGCSAPGKAQWARRFRDRLALAPAASLCCR